eukprot:289075-Rhodomonas_salina.1
MHFPFGCLSHAAHLPATGFAAPARPGVDPAAPCGFPPVSCATRAFSRCAWDFRALPFLDLGEPAAGCFCSSTTAAACLAGRRSRRCASASSMA